MGIFETIRDRARKRAAYNRTLAELSRLPRDIRLDLDIYEGDDRRLAHEAVYGK